MKTLLTLLLAIFSLAATAQKSDTIFVHNPLVDDGNIFVFTVGEVYKYRVVEATPWEDAVFNYLKIVDAEDGWLKYTKAETVEGLDTDVKVEKSRTFYKLYLRRNEWARL